MSSIRPATSPFVFRCASSTHLSVAVLVGVAVAGAAAVAARPSERTVDVLHYSAQLRIDIDAAAVAGRESVQFMAAPGTATTLELDAGALEIDSVTDGLRELAFEKAGTRLSIAVPASAESGRLVDIEYHGVPARGFKVVKATGQVSTAFETSDWLPSVAAPDERATFDLSLVVPRGFAAVASGEPIDRRPVDGGTLVRWRLEAPAPGYVLGFALGPFREATQRAGRVALRYLGPRSLSAKHLRQIFTDTADMLAYFERVAGVVYPHRSYTQVLLENGSGQEMAGFAVMGTRYGEGVLADPANVWLGAHELAHQWWGNGVTNESFRHFWLNEGLATFMAAAYLEQRFGRTAYLAQVEAARAKYEALRDAGKDHALVFDEWTRPSADDRSIVYDKGLYVVHLLREELGEDAFWTGLRAYTTEHWGMSVATRDFEESMERASGRNLDAFFSRWVY